MKNFTNVSRETLEREKMPLTRVINQPRIQAIQNSIIFAPESEIWGLIEKVELEISCGPRQIFVSLDQNHPQYEFNCHSIWESLKSPHRIDYRVQAFCKDHSQKPLTERGYFLPVANSIYFIRT